MKLHVFSTCWNGLRGRMFEAEVAEAEPEPEVEAAADLFDFEAGLIMSRVLVPTLA